MHFNRLLGGVAVAALVGVSAHAQQTSSSLRGAVVDDAGSPVSGAQVTIIHVPTGTAKLAETSATGNFFASGLRVGGPFSVTITAPGLEPSVIDGLSLSVGQTETLNVTLSSADREVITVYGTAQTSQVSLNNGIGSVFSAADLAGQPSIQRDVISQILADPFVTTTVNNGRSRNNGTISIAGQAPRFNGFVVDGLAQGNDFGLDQGLFPTLRQPVSIDWIEETSVQASDYSVLSGGFTGGLVNVVTKSGSNEIDGGLYYYFRDDGLVGDKAFDTDLTSDAFEETEMGAFISGPIIQDKLFFFAGYEEFENTRPLNFDFGDVDPQIFEVIRGITQSVYNYDPGQKSDTSIDELAERLLLKADWNINEFHRASVSWQRSEDNLLTNTGTFSFPTNYYELTSEQDFYKGELVSDWTNNFSTILRVSRKEYVRGQTSLGEQPGLASFGEVEIEVDPTDAYFADNGLDGDALLGGDSATFRLGPDQFRHANTFEDERTVFYGQGDYVWNDHVITFGAEWETYELDNLFGQRAKGFYEFGSLTDFVNQDAFSTYINAQSNDVEDVRAVWGYDKLTLFAGDSWQVNPQFTLNYGIRYERYSQDDTPPAAEPVVNGSGTALLAFEDVYGISAQENLDGLDIIQPRISFRYDYDDRLTFSGGIGIFSGGNPQVWASNNFTPATFFAASFVTDVSGSTVPQVLLDQVSDGVAVGGAVQNIDLFSPNFEIPSVLRASLRADYELNLERWGLGDGYQLSASVLFGDQREQIIWQNLAMLRPDLQRGVAPDGRIIYPDLGDIPVPSDPDNQDADENTNGAEFTVGDAFLIDTTDGGDSLAIALAVSKQYDSGFGFNVSYTNTQSDDLLEYTSSRAVSAWRGGVGTDRNNLSAATSSNEIEHKFVIGLNYERAFVQDLVSQFNLFGIIQSGQPFSYGFDVGGGNPSFGRATGGSPRDGADLLYIPTLNAAGTGFDDPRVAFIADGGNSAAENEADFLAFVRARGLEKYAGGVVPRNSDTSPWTQRWDFRFQQDLPGLPFAEQYVGDNRFKFVLDIENLPNFLNDDWGTNYNRVSNGRFAAVDLDLRELTNGETLSDNEPAEFCQQAGDCQFLYGDVTSLSGLTRRDLDNSVYRVRFGLRYEF